MAASGNPAPLKARCADNLQDMFDEEFRDSLSIKIKLFNKWRHSQLLKYEGLSEKARNETGRLISQKKENDYFDWK